MLEYDNKVMSKKVLIQAFFEQFVSFSKELCGMYPDDSDFSLFSNTIGLMKMTNPSLVVKYVADNVLQYEEKIMSKDETFFMQNEFAEYQADIDMNIFSKLKQYIENMSPSSKEHVWKYIQNIVRLTKAIQSAGN
jgi:O-phosphoseryl-tRNA(Cys) synthetase